LRRIYSGLDGYSHFIRDCEVSMAETFQDPLAELRAEFRRPAATLSVGQLGSLFRTRKTEAKDTAAPLPNIRVQRAPRPMPGKLKVSFASALQRPAARNAPMEANVEDQLKVTE